MLPKTDIIMKTIITMVKFLKTAIIKKIIMIIMIITNANISYKHHSSQE